MGARPDRARRRRAASSLELVPCTCRQAADIPCPACTRWGVFYRSVMARSSERGADMARALLDRIGAGCSTPDELAGLMYTLHSGPLLHGACAVLYAALRHAAPKNGGRR